MRDRSNASRDNKGKIIIFNNMNAISKIPLIVFFAAVFMVTPSRAQLSLENTSSVVKSVQVKRYLYVAVQVYGTTSNMVDTEFWCTTYRIITG